MSDNIWSRAEIIKKGRMGEGGRDVKHNINYTFTFCNLFLRESN